MAEKTYKRTYYFPKILMDLFQEWCKPGRDYSPKIAGAILYYMSLESNIRESCETIAYKNKKAIKDKIAQLAKENRFTGLFSDKNKYSKPEKFSDDPEENEIYQMLDDMARAFAVVHEKIVSYEQAKAQKKDALNRANS